MTSSRSSSELHSTSLGARVRRWLRPVFLNGRNEGPPDLDELWRDLNRRLSGLFSSKPAGERVEGGGGRPPPDGKSTGIGLGLIAGVVALIWLGSGFFIVQEGQQAVVSSFGRYSHTSEAGFQWRMPYPFQSHEVVNLTQLRSVDTSVAARWCRPRACATPPCSRRTRTSSTSASRSSTA